MNACQMHMGWKIDFRKLKEHFTKDRFLINSFYYTREPDREEDAKFIGFLVWTGFTVRTKRVKRYTDPESGQEIAKCNLDVEMVIDTFNTVPLYDAAFFFSGDGDFARAVELLRSKGKRTVAVSTDGMISFDLANAVDEYIELNTLRRELERR